MSGAEQKENSATHSHGICFSNEATSVLTNKNVSVLHTYISGDAEDLDKDTEDHSKI